MRVQKVRTIKLCACTGSRFVNIPVSLLFNYIRPVCQRYVIYPWIWACCSVVSFYKREEKAKKKNIENYTGRFARFVQMTMGRD